jgi:O-methyltransferase
MDPAFESVRGRISGLTMTSPERQYALWKSVEYLESAGIEGDLVECGVWKGGSSMLAALGLLHLGDTDRDLWLYDTFEGMTEPGQFDLGPGGSQIAAEWSEHAGKKDDPVFAYGALTEVKKNMASTGFPAERLHYVEGSVEQTIPDTVPAKLAMIRLDTDWYESTRHELEHLWPLLEPGGVLIVDDYGHWQGSRRAVDEYFADRPDVPLLNRVDDSGRVGVKR